MAPQDAPPSPRNGTRKRRFILFAVIVAALGTIAFGVWWAERGQESTDDAFVEADVGQISPQIAGRVVAVHFKDNDHVEAGALLVEIDPRDYQAARDSAQANVEAAKARVAQAQANLELVRVTATAELARAEKAFRGARQQMEQAKFSAEAAKADTDRTKNDIERYRKLYEATFASRQKLEQVEAENLGNIARYQAAQAASGTAEAAVGQASEQVHGAQTIPQQVAAREADLELAVAQQRQAEADLTTAELNLSYTRVVAPASGRLSKKSVVEGDYVQKGQTLTQFIGESPWVVANFKEGQLTRMRPGQPATIRVDAFPDVTLKGRVASIQPGTGARFSLLPAENATGNFVKVVQRVPVKIEFDPDGPPLPPLALGMSVVPTVDTLAKP